MIDIITQILETLYQMIFEPINNVMMDMGTGNTMATYQLKLGFGSVEWFSIYLDDLLIMVLGLALGFILLRLIYRFIKWLFRLGKGLVGIR